VAHEPTKKEPPKRHRNFTTQIVYELLTIILLYAASDFWSVLAFALFSGGKGLPLSASWSHAHFQVEPRFRERRS